MTIKTEIVEKARMIKKKLIYRPLPGWNSRKFLALGILFIGVAVLLSLPGESYACHCATNSSGHVYCTGKSEACYAVAGTSSCSNICCLCSGCCGGGGGGDDPKPCACRAPATPGLTTPQNGATMLNPDELNVTWTMGGWGIDSGIEPNCRNSTGNDSFDIFYRKTAGGTSDTPPEPPPGVIDGVWYRVRVSRTTRSYILYNLDGGSTYEIKVRANNGCSSRTSSTATIVTDFRPDIGSISIAAQECSADPDGTVWSGKTDLGEWEVDRLRDPANPIKFTTTFTDPNGYEDISLVMLQIALNMFPPQSNYKYLTAMYVKNHPDFDNQTFYLWEDDGWKKQISNGAIEGSRVKLLIGSNKTEATRSGDTLVVNWDVEFLDSFGEGKLKALLYIEDKVGAQDRTSGWKEIYDDGSSVGQNWHRLPITNGSPWGFWGVDLTVPSGTYEMAIDPTYPTRADLKMNLSDILSRLRTSFKRQYKRYLDAADREAAPWNYYEGIGGVTTEGWIINNVNRNYWPGPGSTQLFEDEFNELHGGTYEFRVLGEDYACNVGFGGNPYEIQAPWLRARAGDVYSSTFIDVTLPSIDDQYLGTFLVSYGLPETKMVGAISKNSWEIASYQEANSTKDIPKLLRNRVISKGANIQRINNPVGVWDKIKSTAGNVFFVGDNDNPIDLKIPASEFCTRPVIVFVSGDMEISPDFRNINNFSACMFIIEGSLTINSSEFKPGTFAGGSWTGITDRIEAAFVIGDTLYTTENILLPGQKYAPPSNKLEIYGFVITEGAQFSRNLGDESNNVVPSEEFFYDPRYIMYLSDFLGVRMRRVYECGAVDVPECQLLNSQ